MAVTPQMAIRVFLDLLFPRRCVGCRRRGDWLCAACRDHLVRLPPLRCPRCARPMPAFRTCRYCQADPPEYDDIHCGFLFVETIREAIHRLKYQNARHLAAVLVAEMLRDPSGYPSADLIIPIPLHPARQARRGYNQAELLATALGDHLGIAVSTDSLRRVRDTPSQISLPAARRQTNVRDAFAIGPRSVTGLGVLLVDDVATTGSTLSEAARCLKGGGARRVDALVVARAP